MMDYQEMHDRDLERRARRDARHHRAQKQDESKLDWKLLVSQAAQELAEARRFRRVLVEGKQKAKARLGDVRRWLAGVNLAPWDRTAYEKEVRVLWTEIRWAESELDKLDEKYPQMSGRRRKH